LKLKNCPSTFFAKSKTGNALCPLRDGAIRSTHIALFKKVSNSLSFLKHSTAKNMRGKGGTNASKK